ncbi:MAG: pyridoxal-phosphate dependent enzyme [Chloroflexota bacterium]|nr:pyridoxal-phosphate dependent enzyme [Chloroflexota bacterium]
MSGGSSKTADWQSLPRHGVGSDTRYENVALAYETTPAVGLATDGVGLAMTGDVGDGDARPLPHETTSSGTAIEQSARPRVPMPSKDTPAHNRRVTGELGLPQIIAARAVVDRYLPRAPLERTPLLSAELGADMYLKLETFKPTRTFKVRGALNKIASLDQGARARGVVAASAGSHALGVAYAAAALGAKAVVVMPRGVSQMIVAICRAYGAEVHLEGEVYDDTVALAHEIEHMERRAFIHPYADPLIIAGQGTIGLEILDDLPDAATVIVAVGGGGLIGGVSLALKSRRPEIRVIGVEPEGADAVGRSVARGEPVELEHPRSVADKLVAKSTDAMNIALVQRYVDEMVTVTDRALEAATLEYLERLSLLVEPSGGAPLAALRSGATSARGKTVLVVSGGNVPAALLERIIGDQLSLSAGR